VLHGPSGLGVCCVTRQQVTVGPTPSCASYCPTACSSPIPASTSAISPHCAVRPPPLSASSDRHDRLQKSLQEPGRSGAMAVDSGGLTAWRKPPRSSNDSDERRATSPSYEMPFACVQFPLGSLLPVERTLDGQANGHLSFLYCVRRLLHRGRNRGADAAGLRTGKSNSRWGRHRIIELSRHVVRVVCPIRRRFSPLRRPLQQALGQLRDPPARRPRCGHQLLVTSEVLDGSR
jgi:hypothetical protein